MTNSLMPSALSALTDPLAPSDSQSAATFVLIYDQRPLPEGHLRFKQVLGRVRTRLQHFPQFQRLLRSPSLLGKPQWALDNRFDVEFHVRHLALPKPGDWRQFCIQVARIHSRPLDMSRPPWEINVVEGLDNIPWLGEGHFAMICKVHQGLMDPQQAMDLIWSLHDEISPAPSNSTRRPVAMLPVTAMLGSGLNFALRPVEEAAAQTRNALRRTSESLSPIMRFYHGVLTGGVRVPYTRFNTDVSNYRVWQSYSMALDKLGRLRKAVADAEESDILLAVISGALRLYFEDKTEMAPRELRALMPSFTATGEPAPLQASRDIVDLALHTDDPVERLQQLIRNRAQARTGSPVTPPDTRSPTRSMTDAIRLTLEAQRAKAGMPLANTALIDLGGDAQDLHLMDAPLVYFSGVSEITNGLGLVHVASRHNRYLNLSVTSCREMLPDPDFYYECLERSFEELLSAVAKPQNRKKKDNV
ncbi:diacylglycerol O-acyltransferase [Marinobacterium nitratireducens]|uniref:diacylglycerol O-acyltransferase n=1 Tax=Marinobacterium nitratireducens TaxID=518897 RepID=A0A917ZC75_9GAMM|nr:wax ester/triacylglycerol synthase domain-containing protein [Marinobacterium nitratireducens]GGO80176.1 diacylglycerol O-acyltransferase [Marinobacterium nitratireducens]